MKLSSHADRPLFSPLGGRLVLMPLSWNIEVSEFEFEFYSVLAAGEPPLLSVCLVHTCLCATLRTCCWKTSSCALCRARTCIYTLTSMMRCPCSTRSELATGKPLLLNVCSMQSCVALSPWNRETSSPQWVPRAAPVALSIASCGGLLKENGCGDQSVSRFGLAVWR